MDDRLAFPERPLTVLIAALGGEGGGVMAEWLIDAAAQCGFPAQSTSIPGVAQRTGATTYYLEIYPVRRERLAGREPVMSLIPSPGNVDVMVASELIEAGRAMHNGYVSPERTTLIASTHRVYATVEKMHAADGRFDSGRVLGAARALALRPVLFDMQQLAQEHGTVINAVLLGALAGSGALPLPRAACEQAIRRAGRGTEASLRGFSAAYDIASGKEAKVEGSTDSAKGGSSGKVAATPLSLDDFPAEAREVLALGVARLVDFQGEAYAALYLDRVKAILECDQGPSWRLTGEVARHLAVWMSYEDIVRVADLKTRPARFARVRREVRAKVHEPVVVVDYLKPGVEEFASLMPAPLGRRFVSWAKRRGKLDAYNVGMHVKTSSVPGWLLVRSLAWLKPWRPRSFRYREEQILIERWLAAVSEAARRDAGLALEIAECARLVKGYGDTHRRGTASFLAILDVHVDNPAGADAREQASAIRNAREAALAEPEARPSVKPIVVHPRSRPQPRSS